MTEERVLEIIEKQKQNFINSCSQDELKKENVKEIIDAYDFIIKLIKINLFD